MATSKGILLSGIAIIIGLYTIGMHRADSVYASAASARTSMIQAQYLAESGVEVCLRRLDQGYSTTPDISVLPDPTGANPTMGGLLTSLYVQDYVPGTSATIWSVGEFNNVRVYVVAGAVAGPNLGTTWSPQYHWSVVKGKSFTSPTVYYFNTDTQTWVPQEQVKWYNPPRQ